jgi:hypothetical protein
MWPLAMAGGAGGRNPAAPATGLAGKERGEACELTRDWFLAGAWVGTALANPGGEALRRRPQERRLQRVSGQGASACGLDHHGGCVRRCYRSEHRTEQGAQCGSGHGGQDGGMPVPERCSSLFYRRKREEASMLKKRREVGDPAA